MGSAPTHAQVRSALHRAGGSARRQRGAAASWLAVAASAVGALAGCQGLVGEPGVTPGGGTGDGGSSGSGAGGSTGNQTPALTCTKSFAPGRAPIRRLTRFEYNNTIRDLLGDTTSPASALPAEDLGNGFGNDADKLAVSSLLAEEYGNAAEGIASRATATPTALAKLGACASSVTTTTEESCARTIITTFLPRAYRRPIEAVEADDMVALFRTIRAKPGGTFAIGVAAMLEASLQAPDFLYRIELGVPDPQDATRRRPSGNEMATRLSYLFWGTMPDDGLRAAASSGALLTADGVKAQAARLLADPRSHAMVGFFFDNLLPLSGLTDLARDTTLYPKFSPAIGGLMRQETQRFLEYIIFEGPGDWPSALTADYTFANAQLAAYYGLDGPTGTAFEKVPLDTSKRLGLLTQGSIMAGTTHSNATSPVVRGSFMVQKMMCKIIPLPSGEILAQVKPPEPYSGATARERYTKHSEQAVCAMCHTSMDPMGLALENFDPVGLWRDTENGVTIDASGSVPGTSGAINGPVELARKIASTDAAKTCFASHWIEYGYGRTLTNSADDACTQVSVQNAFKQSGYNVKQLLVSLTQTDAFLYLPAAQ